METFNLPSKLSKSTPQQQATSPLKTLAKMSEVSEKSDRMRSKWSEIAL
jgi:hypothetical protein